MPYQVTSAKAIEGEVQPPSDKSISHRAAILGALAHGPTHIENFLPSADTKATIECLRALGIDIRVEDPCPPTRGFNVAVLGKGRDGFREPERELDVRNSGTTIRILSGLLASLPFTSVVTGDHSILQRPMGRIIEPLRLMGADIRGRDGDRYAPLAIRGAALRGVDYAMPVASAQVKSCILLAGLGAQGPTLVREPAPSRDSAERMLRTMGARVSVNGNNVAVEPGPLHAAHFRVPGDASSAAPWMVLAAAHPSARLHIRGVGINPRRIGIVGVLRSMGAKITIQERAAGGPMPVADISVETARLTAVSIHGDIIPNVIDEIPIIALAATQADGETIIRDAAELRVKESDRIKTTVAELRKLGADIEELPDGMIIRGPTKLKGAPCCSHGDHRIAMTLGIAGLLAQDETLIYDPECVDVSYPGFWEDLESLRAC